MLKTSELFGEFNKNAVPIASLNSGKPLGIRNWRMYRTKISRNVDKFGNSRKPLGILV